MIPSAHHRAGGVTFSGFYTLGCLWAVLLAGCSSPAPVAGPVAKSEVPASAPVVAAPEPVTATSPPIEAANALPVKATKEAPAPVAATGNAERGQELYESRCFACHSLDANRVGPSHEGLFGRTAGKFRDYDYSAAVKASKIVWNEKTLDAWLTDPQALIPGQKMNYAVTDRTDRADIIAYLKAATSAK